MKHIYFRVMLINHEDMKRKATEWLREMVHDPKYFLTSANFQEWFNDFLKTLELSDGFHKTILEVTAYRYVNHN